MALRNAKQREKYASSPDYRAAHKQEQKAWLKEHPEFRLRRQAANNARRKQRYASEPEYRARMLLYLTSRRHGLTIDEYELLIAEGCAVCGSHEDLHVDHDHDCCPGTGDGSCGKCIVGALCRSHNLAAGFCHENPGEAKALAVYLNHKQLLRSQRRSRTDK